MSVSAVAAAPDVQVPRDAQGCAGAAAAVDAPPLVTIDRRSGLSAREFVEEYAKPRRPVVLTDALSRCAAATKWTPQFFAERYGDTALEIDGRWWTIGEYLQRMAAGSTPEHPLPYPFSFDLEKSFPELLEDIRGLAPGGPWERTWNKAVPRRFLSGTRPHEIIFGANGTSFPILHFDVLCLDSHLTQILGEKDFFLYPPDQAAYMYPRADNPKFSSIDDFIHPDYERFPLFRNARPVVVTLRQGETIWFPTGWWHYTRIHGPCITYGEISLSRWNWNAVTSDLHETWRRYHPRLAGALDLAAHGLGIVLAAIEPAVS